MASMSTRGLKPGDRRYNIDTNSWEMKPKAKSTPTKSAPKSKPKKAKPKKAPVPRPRSERKTTPAGMPGRTSAPSRAGAKGRTSAPSRASVGGRTSAPAGTFKRASTPQTLRNSGRPAGFSTTRYRGPRG